MRLIDHEPEHEQCCRYCLINPPEMAVECATPACINNTEGLCGRLTSRHPAHIVNGHCLHFTQHHKE